MQSELLVQIDRAIKLDGADVVILGGAPLAGMASRLQPSSAAVLIDPIGCAVTLAESLVKITGNSALANRHTKPAAKATVGLPQPLATIFEHD